MPEEVLSLLFNHVDPLYEQHTLLLKEMEHRLAAWYIDPTGFSFLVGSSHANFNSFYREGRTNAFTKGDVHRIGDLLLKIAGKIEVFWIQRGNALPRRPTN